MKWVMQAVVSQLEPLKAAARWAMVRNADTWTSHLGPRGQES